MSVPSAALQTEVSYLILLEAEFRGVSADSLNTRDLQALAYGVRLSALNYDDSDAEWAQSLRDVANALDGLSDLDPDDLKFLEGLHS